MFSVLVTKQIAAVAANDRYGTGINFVAPDISDLTAGGIVALHNDGSLIPRTASGDIADDIAIGFETIKLQVNGVNGLKGGIVINPKTMRISKQVYVAPAAKVVTCDLDGKIPVDLDPYVGQYATFRVVDKSKPTYAENRVRVYSVILTDANILDIDLIAAEMVAMINHDYVGVVTAAWDAVNVTMTFTGVVGKDFSVIAEDILREGDIATTTEVVFGTPTANLKTEELSRASWDGYNISKMASELYNVQPDVVDATTYVVYVITSVNNVGPSHDPTFTQTQILAVPAASTGLITELDALFAYLLGDTTAAWSANA